jgi:hypothetical protein
MLQSNANSNLYHIQRTGNNKTVLVEQNTSRHNVFPQFILSTFKMHPSAIYIITHFRRMSNMANMVTKAGSAAAELVLSPASVSVTASSPSSREIGTGGDDVIATVGAAVKSAVGRAVVGAFVG